MSNLSTGNLLVDYYLQQQGENFFDEDDLKQENVEEGSQQDWQKVLDKVMQF